MLHNIQGRSQDLARVGVRIFFSDLEICCKNSKNYHFLYNNLKNYHFLYNFFKKCRFYIKKTYILDTRLLWGNSHEEIFENIL